MSVVHVVLAGGFGTLEEQQPTLYSTVRTPKLIEQVNGRSLLAHALDAPRLAHEFPLAVVLNGKLYQQFGPQYDEALKGIIPSPTTHFQPDGGGTFVALECARPTFVGAEHVLTTLGDMPFITAPTIHAVVEQHLGSNADITVGVFDLTLAPPRIRTMMERWGRVPLRCGSSPQGVYHEGDGFVPPKPREQIPYVYTSLTIIRRTLIDELGPHILPRLKKNERSLCDLVNLAHDGGHRTQCVKLTNYQELLGVNTRDDFTLARRLLTRTQRES